MLGLPEIAISTTGFGVSPESPKETIDQIHALGVRGIAIDASVPAFRPRELSRSARRDLAAALRRRELEFVGLDLWIPPEHFVDPVNAQRAIEAVEQAAEMSAEIATLVGGRSKPIVSVLLPENMKETDRLAIGAHAQRVGTTIADHQLDQGVDVPGIGIGIDPVIVLMTGQYPGKVLTQSTADLVSARLSDLGSMGRCVVGSQGSRLDLRSYAGALIVSGQQWVTLDVRELPDPIMAARHAARAWLDAGTI